MFPKSCPTTVKRNLLNGRLYTCGVPAPKAARETSESKQEHEVEGFEFDKNASGQSLWVPAGNVLCFPTDGGLPVQMSPEAFESEFGEP